MGTAMVAAGGQASGQANLHQGNRLPDAADAADAAEGKPDVAIIPLQAAHLCRFLGGDQQQYLALRVGPWQYTFYRRQASLDRANALVQQWQRRGHAALATHDDGYYAVWVKDLHCGAV